MEGMLCIDGRVAGPGAVDAVALWGAGFVYQRMHCLEMEPLHAGVHVGIVCDSYSALYGERPELDADILSCEVRLLLEANRCLRGSVEAVVYLVPRGGAGMPHRLLAVSPQPLYPGYQMRHAGLRAVVVPYDVSFAQHKTAASLAAHACMARYARRTGADIALREDRWGRIAGAGEDPLLAVVGDRVIAPPDAAPGVERMLALDAAVAAGLTVDEAPITAADIAACDELFTVTTQGVCPVTECMGVRYPHSMAANIAREFKMVI